LLEGKTIKRFGLNKINKYITWNVNEIHRTRPDYLWKAPKKIIIQRISGGSNPLTATIDTNKYKTFASINNLLLKQQFANDYEFFAALINSKVLNWYYANNYSNNSELTVNISKTFLEKLPIPNISAHTHSIITNLVDKILTAKLDTIQLINTSELENQLDEIIFKLYDLTYDEVKIIDPGFWLSEAEYDKIIIEPAPPSLKERINLKAKEIEKMSSDLDDVLEENNEKTEPRKRRGRNAGNIILPEL
jgi:hypothetical protein